MEGEGLGPTTLLWCLLVSAVEYTLSWTNIDYAITVEPAICSQISAVTLACSSSESCHQGRLEFLDFLLNMH